MDLSDVCPYCKVPKVSIPSKTFTPAGVKPQSPVTVTKQCPKCKLLS